MIIRSVECVPPFTHTVTQLCEGLALKTLQCRGKGTLSPDISEYSVVELLRTESRRGFSLVCGADASPTRSWTHADASPSPFSADTARLAPSDRQRIGESSPNDGLP